MSKNDLSICKQQLLSLQQSINLEITPFSNKIIFKSDHDRSVIRQVQQRLMTYKELKLHENLIDDAEIKQLLQSMTLIEKDIALNSMECIELAIVRIDEWLAAETL